jgi:hypothetical protein
MYVSHGDEQEFVTKNNNFVISAVANVLMKYEVGTATSYGSQRGR